MKSLALLVVLIALAFIALVLLNSKLGRVGEKGPWPFYPKRPLSKPEQVLYFRLVSALPDHIVLAQVQLSRFLGVKKGEQFHRWNNRINRKSVDFLVCSKDAKVVLAVELDDSTHTKESRVHADATKDRALTDGGINLIRWNVKLMPDIDTIRAAVAATTAVSSGAVPDSSKVESTRRTRGNRRAQTARAINQVAPGAPQSPGGHSSA